ncbi:disulfide bond formation protein B [Poriferisphaera corsica]|uniref:disulfide bond formation protein B n=1 Tax=Poriferisphaera corsica TaxID=2528020 RepID=UPI00119FB094|nr:disulfide bond formation protein B [Poriferisphaera corsica]
MQRIAMPPQPPPLKPSQVLNLILLTLTLIVLLLPLAFQFSMREIPCPLCLLQRFALLGVALGPILNLRFQTHPRHYAISLFSALFGITIATRQILLHILPSTPTFGSPILSLHFYTWSFLLFTIIILILAVIFFLDNHTNPPPPSRHTSPTHPSSTTTISTPFRTLPRITQTLFIATLLITLFYTYTTYRICHFSPCPPSPTEKFTTPIE